MAEAEFGPGRLAEPTEIADAVEAMLADAVRLRASASWRGRGTTAVAASGPLAGRRVLVTSGPTHEPIDRSATSPTAPPGARSCHRRRRRGRRVRDGDLVSGPVAIPDRPACRWCRSRPRARCWRRWRRPCRPTSPSSPPPSATGGRPRRADPRSRRTARCQPPSPWSKIPTSSPPSPGRPAGRPRLVVGGFAAETDAVLDNARAKIVRKGCDLIVANDVSPAAA